MLIYFYFTDNETPIIPIDIAPASSSEEIVEGKEKPTKKRSFKAAKTK
jgi:hypothetical protein